MFEKKIQVGLSASCLVMLASTINKDNSNPIMHLLSTRNEIETFRDLLLTFFDT